MSEIRMFTVTFLLCPMMGRKLQNLAAGFTAFSPFQTEFCHKSSVLGCVFLLPLLFYDLSVSNRGVAWTSRFPSPCAIIKL